MGMKEVEDNIKKLRSEYIGVHTSSTGAAESALGITEDYMERIKQSTERIGATLLANLSTHLAGAVERTEKRYHEECAPLFAETADGAPEGSVLASLRQKDAIIAGILDPSSETSQALSVMSTNLVDIVGHLSALQKLVEETLPAAAKVCDDYTTVSEVSEEITRALENRRNF